MRLALPVLQGRRTTKRRPARAPQILLSIPEDLTRRLPHGRSARSFEGQVQRLRARPLATNQSAMDSSRRSIGIGFPLGFSLEATDRVIARSPLDALLLSDDPRQ